MFITEFTSARHLSLSSASSIQSIPPHPTSWISILILSSHLCLGIPSGLLPSGFPNKTLFTPLLSPILATWAAHLTLLDFITRTILGEEYRSLSSSLCTFLYSLVTSSHLGSNILLNTLFSNTISLRSSLNVRDHVSHPYKTTGKIILFTSSSAEVKEIVEIYLCSPSVPAWQVTGWNLLYPSMYTIGAHSPSMLHYAHPRTLKKRNFLLCDG